MFTINKVMDRLRPVVDSVIRNLAQQWDTNQVQKFKTQWTGELEKGLAEKVGPFILFETSKVTLRKSLET